MKIATSCKFCKKPITLTIDDSYDVSDPFKLIPIAACNHCSELRIKRRQVESLIESFVCRLMQSKGENLDNAKRESLEPLTALTKSYSRIVGEWKKETPMWDAECVFQILDKPKQWGEILGQMWKVGGTSELFEH